MSDLNEPKKETVRITLPPRTGGTGTEKAGGSRETVRIDSPETAPPGSSAAPEPIEASPPDPEISAKPIVPPPLARPPIAELSSPAARPPSFNLPRPPSAPSKSPLPPPAAPPSQVTEPASAAPGMPPRPRVLPPPPRVAGGRASATTVPPEGRPRSPVRLFSASRSRRATSGGSSPVGARHSSFSRRSVASVARMWSCTSTGEREPSKRRSSPSCS